MKSAAASARAERSQGTGSAGAWSVARAFAVDGLSTAQRLVLAVLLARADRDGFAWPHASEVALRTSLAVRTVGRIVAQLAALGFVERAQARPGELLPNGIPSPDARAVVRVTLGSVRAFIGGAIDLAIAPGLSLSPTERAVLAALLLHANGARQAWPTQARLAAVAGCSVRAVGSALAALRSAQAIAYAMLPPGAQLPTGAQCSGWRALVTLFPGGIRALGSTAVEPRSACAIPPPDVQTPPDRGAEGSDPLNRSSEERRAREPEGSPDRAPAAPTVPAPAALEATATREVPDLLLDEWNSKLCVDSGANARAMLAARLAEGVTPREIREAIAGIALIPWRMDPAAPSKRHVTSCAQSAAKLRDFAAVGRAGASCANPEPVELLPPPPPPVRIAPEERRAQAAQVRAMLAAGPARPLFFAPRRAVDRA